ncbi:MAG: preprotein translocase subunit SecG [Myxococcales bacterium]|nr:preprotein translocase subunit SecG [Myxococcales bacterium]
MSFIVTIVHVGVSLFLMLTVLLQAGKGGGMGATFGGGSSQGSVFGGSGAGNFLSKLTTASAAMFMLTSMTLAYLASTTGDDPLKSVSRQARTNAEVKKKLDQQAEDLFNSTQPDAGLTDEIPNLDSVEPIDAETDAEGATVDAPSADAPSADGEAEAAGETKPAPKNNSDDTAATVAPASEPKPTPAPGN